MIGFFWLGYGDRDGLVDGDSEGEIDGLVDGEGLGDDILGSEDIFCNSEYNFWVWAWISSIFRFALLSFR